MRLERATDGKHKWVAVFDDGTRTAFGARGYMDYTQHRDPLRRANYLQRHRTTENWRNPKTAGALSRWILWEMPTFAEGLRAFKTRFHL